MGFVECLSFTKRFRSPGALAVFGAFAAPEPLGAIMLICAVVWWWQRSCNVGTRCDPRTPRLIEALACDNEHSAVIVAAAVMGFSDVPREKCLRRNAS